MYKILFVLIFGLIIFSSGNFLYADSHDQSPLGFKFGISDGNAKNQIVSQGHSIIKNEKDSKDVRTILFDGTIVEVTEIDDIEQKTRLEFFENKLMTTAVMIKTNDDLQFVDVQNDLLKRFVTLYGEPDGRDNMLNYDIWEWDINDMQLILSANRSKGKFKLEYTYHPVATSKHKKELEFKRKGEVRSPVDQMFKDGNFSQQGGPDNRNY